MCPLCRATVDGQLRLKVYKPAVEGLAVTTSSFLKNYRFARLDMPQEHSSKAPEGHCDTTRPKRPISNSTPSEEEKQQKPHKKKSRMLYTPLENDHNIEDGEIVQCFATERFSPISEDMTDTPG